MDKPHMKTKGKSFLFKATIILTIFSFIPSSFSFAISDLRTTNSGQNPETIETIQTELGQGPAAGHTPSHMTPTQRAERDTPQLGGRGARFHSGGKKAAAKKAPALAKKVAVANVQQPTYYPLKQDGHYHNTDFNIKYVTKGTGIQYLVYKNKREEVVTLAQYLKPGTWAYALPGTISFVVDLGGLEYGEESFDVTKVAKEYISSRLDNVDDFADDSGKIRLLNNGATYAVESRYGEPYIVCDPGGEFKKQNIKLQPIALRTEPIPPLKRLPKNTTLDQLKASSDKFSILTHNTDNVLKAIFDGLTKLPPGQKGLPASLKASLIREKHRSILSNPTKEEEEISEELTRASSAGDTVKIAELERKQQNIILRRFLNSVVGSPEDTLITRAMLKKSLLADWFAKKEVSPEEQEKRASPEEQKVFNEILRDIFGLPDKNNIRQITATDSGRPKCDILVLSARPALDLTLNWRRGEGSSIEVEQALMYPGGKSMLFTRGLIGLGYRPKVYGLIADDETGEHIRRSFPGNHLSRFKGDTRISVYHSVEERQDLLHFAAQSSKVSMAATKKARKAIERGIASAKPGDFFVSEVQGLPMENDLNATEQLIIPSLIAAREKGMRIALNVSAETKKEQIDSLLKEISEVSLMRLDYRNLVEWYGDKEKTAGSTDEREQQVVRRGKQFVQEHKLKIGTLIISFGKKKTVAIQGDSTRFAKLPHSGAIDEKYESYFLGAGDIFLAGLIKKLAAREPSLEKAMEFGLAYSLSFTEGDIAGRGASIDTKLKEYLRKVTVGEFPTGALQDPSSRTDAEKLTRGDWTIKGKRYFPTHAYIFDYDGTIAPRNTDVSISMAKCLADLLRLGHSVYLCTAKTKEDILKLEFINDIVKELGPKDAAYINNLILYTTKGAEKTQLEYWEKLDGTFEIDSSNTIYKTFSSTAQPQINEILTAKVETLKKMLQATPSATLRNIEPKITKSFSKDKQGKDTTEYIKIQFQPYGELPLDAEVLKRNSLPTIEEIAASLEKEFKVSGAATAEDIKAICIESGGRTSIDITFCFKSTPVTEVQAATAEGQAKTPRYAKIFYFGDEPKGNDRAVFILAKRTDLDERLIPVAVKDPKATERFLREQHTATIADNMLNILYAYATGELETIDDNTRDLLCRKFYDQNILNYLSDNCVLKDKEKIEKILRGVLLERNPEDVKLFQAIFFPGSTLKDMEQKPKALLLRGGRAASLLTQALVRLGVGVEVMVAGTDDGRGYAHAANLLCHYFETRGIIKDSFTGVPDTGKTLLDTLDQVKNKKLVVLMNKRLKGTYKSYANMMADGNFNAALREAFPDSIKKRAEVKKYIFAFFEVLNHPHVQRAIAEYRKEVEDWIKYYDGLIDKANQSGRDVNKASIYQGIRDEFAAELGKPEGFDMRELAFRNVILIGIRANSSDWQEANNTFARLLGSTSRIYRVTTRAKHLVGLLKNEIVLPNEDTVNEVMRDNVDEDNVDNLYLLDNPLTLEQLAHLDTLSDIQKKRDYLERLQGKIEDRDINDAALAAVGDADIILFPQTSIYSNAAPSLIPPAVGERIADNRKATKILVATPVRENEPRKITSYDHLKFILSLLKRDGPHPNTDYIQYVISRSRDITEFADIPYLATRADLIQETTGIPVVKINIASIIDVADERSPVKYDPQLLAKNIVSLHLLRKLGYEIGTNGALIKHNPSRQLQLPLSYTPSTAAPAQPPASPAPTTLVVRRPDIGARADRKAAPIVHKYTDAPRGVPAGPSRPALRRKILEQNKAEEAAQNIIEFDSTKQVEAFIDIANNLNGVYATRKDVATYENLSSFYHYVISKALAVKDSDTAKQLQLIAAQSLNIIWWIKNENEVPGAQKIELTANEGEMVKHPDAPKKYPLGSYLKAGSFQPVPGLAAQEGAPGFLWRGSEGISKLDGNILDEAKYKPEEFDARKDNLLLYIMDHGFIPPPEVKENPESKSIRQMTEEGKISTIHETSFTTDLLPGSHQYTSTGAGHFQRNQLDIKEVTEGHGIQFNVKYDEEGKVVEVLAHYLTPGTWTLALPGYVDYVVNLGGLRFNDVTITLDPEKDKEQIEAFAPGVKPPEKFVAPYAAVKKGDDIELVKVADGADIKWICGPDIFTGKTLLSQYTTFTPKKITEIVQKALKFKSIQELLARLATNINDNTKQDPDKPWIAELLESESSRWAISKMDETSRAQADVVHIYYELLQKATKQLAEKGVVKLELTNIRTGPQGYKWGPPAKYSYILHTLGVVDKNQGRILDLAKLNKILGLDPNTPKEEAAEIRVAERWFVSDDTKYPSWALETVDGKPVAVPLFWLLRHNPEAALGREHAEAYQEALGMVAKYLNAAEPLSGQVHIGISEGYLVITMDEGTGLFLGVNDPATDKTLDEQKRENRRLEMISRVRAMIQVDNTRVVRWPNLDTIISPNRDKNKVQVPYATLEETLKVVRDGITDDMSIPKLVEHLLTNGINVIDLAGFGVDEQGNFDPQWALIQAIGVKSGDRIVIRDGKPHALYGHTRENEATPRTGTFIEFKGTDIGSPDSRAQSDAQTWSFIDNLLGKYPRADKVVASGKLSLDDLFKNVTVDTLLRRTTQDDYAPNQTTDVVPIQIAQGVTSQRLHEEDQYSARQYQLAPGTAVKLVRHGQHSAIVNRTVWAEGDTDLHRQVIKNGKIRVETVKGEFLIKLGPEEEAFIMADKGDLILRSVGEDPAVIVEFKRSVKNVALPEIQPVPASAPGPAAELPIPLEELHPGGQGIGFYPRSRRTTPVEPATPTVPVRGRSSLDEYDPGHIVHPFPKVEATTVGISADDLKAEFAPEGVYGKNMPAVLTDLKGKTIELVISRPALGVIEETRVIELVEAVNKNGLDIRVKFVDISKDIPATMNFSKVYLISENDIDNLEAYPASQARVLAINNLTDPNQITVLHKAIFACLALRSLEPEDVMNPNNEKVKATIELYNSIDPLSPGKLDFTKLFHLLSPLNITRDLRFRLKQIVANLPTPSIATGEIDSVFEEIKQAVGNI